MRLLEVDWWPTVHKGIWLYVKGCDICQKYKCENTKPSGFLQHTQVTEPGHTLGMDMMGPFPLSKNTKHLPLRNSRLLRKLGRDVPP